MGSLWPVLLSLLTITAQMRSLVDCNEAPISAPELTLRPANTYYGHHVTISCFSRSGSLPITYSLFRDISYVEATTVNVPRTAIFNITIYNSSSLGPYKCKANNSASPNGTYSQELTFILLAPVSTPELTLRPPSTYSGHNMTISCLSRSGTLPVTYSLFHNMTYIGAITVDGSTRTGTFSITIYNSSSRGPYKCKANNSAIPDGIYSRELAFSLLEPLSNTEMTAEPPNVTIGQNAAIQCFSRKGSFPITYSLYHNKTPIGTMNMTEARPAIFIVTLYDFSSQGPYKCRATNTATPNGTYSQEFTFSLQDQTPWGWQNIIRLTAVLLFGIITAIVCWIVTKGQRGEKRSSTTEDLQYRLSYVNVAAET